MENLQSQQVAMSRQVMELRKDLNLFFLFNTSRQYRLLRELVISKTPGRSEPGWITAEVVRNLLARIAGSGPVVQEIQSFLGQPEDPTLSEIVGASPLSRALYGPIDRLLVARVSDVLDREEDFALNFLAQFLLDLAVLPRELVDDFGHFRLKELRDQIDTIPLDLKLLERAPIYEQNLENLVALGHSCRAQLIANYEPLVFAIARQRWAGLASGAHRRRESPITFDDLVQQGRIALMNAIEKFNIRRVINDSRRAINNGRDVVSFASYARPAIHHEISDFIRHNLHAMAMPKEVAAERQRMALMEDRLREELGRDDVEQELCDALEMTWEKFLKIRHSFLPAISLDNTVGDDTELTLGDTLGDSSVNVEEAVCSRLMSEKMLQALKTLPERDRQVLNLRFGLDGNRELTLDELGRELGISRQAVHKTVGRVLKKLRDPGLGLVDG